MIPDQKPPGNALTYISLPARNEHRIILLVLAILKKHELL